MFHHNAPRPPVVPGEETEGLVQSGSNCSGALKAYNPALTPRTSSLYQHSVQDGIAPLGFEPEGRSGSPHFSDSRSPPGFLLWARDLPSLLSDPDGVSLFKRYLTDEGKSHSDQLDFWFAIEGLRKQTDPDKIAQFVKVIYRRYFLKSQLGISDSQRKAVHKRLNDTIEYDIHIFDKAQSQVERLINDTTYPNFLRSEMYLNHVQSMQNGCNGSSSGSSGPESHGGGGAKMLATLHEDQELDMSAPAPSFAPLTKDMLMFTQKRRACDAVPKPEVFAGLYLHGKGASKSYSSYNPVSRQDSELQSLSSHSDARTESDNLSLTDSSVDGMSVYKPTRRQFQRHCRQVKESASLNRDPSLHHTVIPRTQRMVKEQAHPMKPEDFAQILIKKLETVKKDQEAEEKFAHRLLESEDGCGPSAKTLADAIRERFGIDDDNDQDILDQHVSRVWSDLTPSRTPGLASPRPRSPDALRRSRSSQSTPKMSAGAGSLTHGSQSLHHQGPLHYLTRPPHSSRYPRKERDGFSTFSSDSGNVNDFVEDKLHLPKSKSVPDYSDSTDTYSSMPSHDGRYRSSREWSNARRHLSKKPELTDSGVSVVSESVSIGSHGNKDKVMSWLIESDRSGCCSHADRDSERASSCSGSSRFEGKHHTRPNPVRGRRSPPTTGPAQPFIADPSMPPLPSPHTPTQLDEARRRLEDQTRCKQMRQRSSQGSKQEISTSVSSTLKKSKEAFTTVVSSFCDEQYPYMFKIPGSTVTLRQFKECLPKKGNYRYFFKTECEELDMKVIQEEITDDNELLPLWEGKIMVQIKPVE